MFIPKKLWLQSNYCKSTFTELKKTSTKSPVLNLYDFKETILESILSFNFNAEVTRYFTRNVTPESMKLKVYIDGNLENNS